MNREEPTKTLLVQPAKTLREFTPNRESSTDSPLLHQLIKRFVCSLRCSCNIATLWPDGFLNTETVSGSMGKNACSNALRREPHAHIGNLECLGENYSVMNCLFHAYSTAIFTRSGRFIVKNSFCSFSNAIWRRSVEHAGIKIFNLEFSLKRFRVRCYSSRSKSRARKLDPKPVMKDEKDAFFVVRKGDIVGVYKNLIDCQAQVGSSICDPPVSVYKGHCMPKGTAEYLLSCGLKNALYSIRAADLTEELFGSLIPCPFQLPSSSRSEASSDESKKRSFELLGSETREAIGSTFISDAIGKHVKLDHHVGAQALFSARSCTLEFDGASKGNPGQAGAGAVLRADDGSLIYRLREGLGIATNNVAEYRGMILGLRCALQKGFTSIRVRGDSKLVCMQIQGLWKVKNQNISSLYEEAKKLKDKFLSFQIIHVLRDLNSDADAQANLAVDLADGQVQEEVEN